MRGTASAPRNGARPVTYGRHKPAVTVSVTALAPPARRQQNEEHRAGTPQRGDRRVSFGRQESVAVVPASGCGRQPRTATVRGTESTPRNGGRPITCGRHRPAVTGSLTAPDTAARRQPDEQHQVGTPQRGDRRASFGRQESEAVVPASGCGRQRRTTTVWGTASATRNGGRPVTESRYKPAVTVSVATPNTAARRQRTRAAPIGTATW